MMDLGLFQVVSQAVCFLVELGIRLYLTPPLLAVLSQKLIMEKAARIGQEVMKKSLLLGMKSRYVTPHPVGTV